MSTEGLLAEAGARRQPSAGTQGSAQPLCRGSCPLPATSHAGTTALKTGAASEPLAKGASYCCVATWKGGIPSRHSDPGLSIL